MDRSKGIAYCGLACCVCSENKTCPGCRDSGCAGKQGCKNLRCCREKGLDGCWECPEFPCSGGILDKPRIRAFAAFVKLYGKEQLLNCLERNEKNGIIYHDAGQLTGDYDKPETQEAIIEFILSGKPKP